MTCTGGTVKEPAHGDREGGPAYAEVRESSTAVDRKSKGITDEERHLAWLEGRDGLRQRRKDEAGDGGRLLEPVLTMRRRPTAAPGC